MQARDADKGAREPGAVPDDITRLILDDHEVFRRDFARLAEEEHEALADLRLHAAIALTGRGPMGENLTKRGSAAGPARTKRPGAARTTRYTWWPTAK